MMSTWRRSGSGECMRVGAGVSSMCPHRKLEPADVMYSSHAVKVACFVPEGDSLMCIEEGVKNLIFDFSCGCNKWMTLTVTCLVTNRVVTLSELFAHM